MSSGDHIVCPSDPELRQLMEDFDRLVFEQSQLSITEDLMQTLPYQTGPDESGAVEGPTASRIEPVLEGVNNGHSDNELIFAPELVEALRQPSLCKYAYLPWFCIVVSGTCSVVQCVVCTVYSLRVSDSLSSVVYWQHGD